jgi:hypothetical protein
MAGIVVPTIVLLWIAVVYAYHVFYVEVPSQFIFGLPARPLERTILFPMAVVPNLWGIWNMLWVATRSRTGLSIGLHGCVIPVLLVPGGIFLARTTELFYIQTGFALLAIPVGMAIYYLAWKFIVGSLNAELGIA